MCVCKYARLVCARFFETHVGKRVTVRFVDKTIKISLLMPTSRAQVRVDVFTSRVELKWRRAGAEELFQKKKNSTVRVGVYI